MWPTTALADGARAAFALLSRLPVRKASDPARAAPWLWLPGALIGLGAAASAHLVANPFVAAAVALAMSAMLSGGMHLEAVADFADGLAARHADEAAYDRARKDPRIGAIGAVALGVVLLLKWALLVAWVQQGAPILVLVCAAALARGWAAAWVAWFGARGSGTATMLQAHRHKKAVALGLLLLMLASSGERWPIGWAGAFFAVLWGLAVRRALGGFDGDALGAGIELAEIAMLFAWVQAQA